MIKVDTLFECPVCESQHEAEEWNMETEDYFGAGIRPIEISSPDYRYVCPTCTSVCDGEDITSVE